MAIADAKTLKEYLYRVSEFVIMCNGEQDFVPVHCVTGLRIQHDFTSNIYPIFKVTVTLNADRYFRIMKNKLSVKFKLRIQKYYVTPSSQDASLMKDYINDTFSLIPDDDDVNANKNTSVSKSSIDDASSVPVKDDYVMELFLYRDEVATAMKTQINDVLTGVSLTDAIGYICGSVGLKNVLLSPLDNQKTYSQLILPPLSVHKELQHLDSQYGFYKSGSMIYFGLKNSYILNFKGGCTAYANGEIQQVNFLVLKKYQNTTIDSGMFLMNNTQYNINWLPDKVKANNKSVTNDVLYGNSVSVVDSSTTEIASSTSKAVTKGKSSNSTILRNDGENTWMANTYTAQTNSESMVLTGSVSNVDLDAFTPNKKMNVIFEDSSSTNKFKGIYLLSKATFEFLNLGGVDFSVSVGFELKRVSEDSGESSSYMD